MDSILRSNSKKLSKNIALLTLVQISSYVLPLVSVPIISRRIGAENFGLINFGAAFITYFTLFISYSFDFTATRKILRSQGDVIARRKIFSEVFYTQCILLFCCTIAFAFLILCVHQLRELRVLLMFSYLLCISLVFTQNWLYQAMQDLGRLAIFNLVSRVIFTFAVIGVVEQRTDYVFYPLVLGSVSLIVSIYSFWWAYKKYQLKFVRFSFRDCFRLLMEDRMIFFSLIFVNLYTYTNTVILGFFQPPVQVGYFTAAQKLVIIAQSVISMPIAMTFYPFIGQEFLRSRENGMQIVHKLLPAIIGLTIFAWFFMVLIAPFLILSFYGSDFTPSILAFQILAIVPLLYSLNNVLGVQIMLNLGMDKKFLFISAGGALFSIVFNFFAVRDFGYLGSTVNWLCTELFLFISMLLVLKKQGIYPISLKQLRFSNFVEMFKKIMELFRTRVNGSFLGKD